MIICVMGPSGIGKTKLSVLLAKRYNAVIVNADATQIYKELNIGSAKITEEEKCGIEHLLFDIKNPNEDYSVCDYQNDARKILDENKNKNIIVVGGTGLYVKALFNDYNFVKMSNVNYDNYTNEELYLMAQEKDKNVDIHKNNRVRLINFLKRDTNETEPKELYNVIYIGLTMPREKVYEKVNNRVDKMFEIGLVDEVKNLYKKYPNSNILKRAIGYKEVISYLNGEISLDEAKELIKKNTRHYVKRQYTWNNHQMNLNNFDVTNFDQAYEEIISLIDSLNSK